MEKGVIDKKIKDIINLENNNQKNISNNIISYTEKVYGIISERNRENF